MKSQMSHSALLWPLKQFSQMPKRCISPFYMQACLRRISMHQSRNNIIQNSENNINIYFKWLRCWFSLCSMCPCNPCSSIWRVTGNSVYWKITKLNEVPLMEPAFTGGRKTRNDPKRLSFTVKQRTPMNIPLVASFYYVVKNIMIFLSITLVMNHLSYF